jgi:YD repeat-containing protein
MTSATIGGVTRTYAYNGDGLLASRTEGASTTTFLWDVSLSPDAFCKLPAPGKPPQSE